MHPPGRADSTFAGSRRSRTSGGPNNLGNRPGSQMIARKTCRLVPLASGVGLLTCPYFVANNLVLLGICLVLAALPLVVRP